MGRAPPAGCASGAGAPTCLAQSRSPLATHSLVPGPGLGPLLPMPGCPGVPRGSLGFPVYRQRKGGEGGVRGPVPACVNLNLKSLAKHNGSGHTNIKN